MTVLNIISTYWDTNIWTKWCRIEFSCSSWTGLSIPVKVILFLLSCWISECTTLLAAVILSSSLLYLTCSFWFSSCNRFIIMPLRLMISTLEAFMLSFILSILFSCNWEMISSWYRDSCLLSRVLYSCFIFMRILTQHKKWKNVPLSRK